MPLRKAACHRRWHGFPQGTYNYHRKAMLIKKNSSPFPLKYAQNDQNCQGLRHIKTQLDLSFSIPNKHTRTDPRIVSDHFDKLSDLYSVTSVVKFFLDSPSSKPGFVPFGKAGQMAKVHYRAVVQNNFA